MNLIDNFIFQYFTDTKNQILNGVATRKYLFDKNYKFPGCLKYYYSETDSMVQSLMNWKVSYSNDSKPDDSEIYICMKTFLSLCENAEKNRNLKRYLGITQSISGLLRIVCLNNPAYLSYENYVYHITQSEVVIQFILSLFNIGYDESVFAFGGGNPNIKNKYEIEFDLSKGKFVSRQFLIGHLTDSPALTSLLYCMRQHRNFFSHKSSTDSNVAERGSDLHTYIINRNESLNRLCYLLIDYITIFFFLQQKLKLKYSFKAIKDIVSNEKIALEVFIKEGRTDCKLTLSSKDQKAEKICIVDDKYKANIVRFRNYKLTIDQPKSTNSVQFMIDHTYTNDIKLIISIPPGKFESIKPKMEDIIDADYIPEFNMMKEIWDECKFEKDIADFINIAKELTLKSFMVNRGNNEGIKSLKKSITDSIMHMHEKIKNEGIVSLSDVFNKTKKEIANIHDKMKQALDSKKLEEACILIDEAFAKQNYLKTDGSKNGLTRIEQILEASKNFLDNKILNLSNTENDKFIEDVNIMTLLNAILEVGDLNMLYLLKDRIELISSSREKISQLASDFYTSLNDEVITLQSNDNLSNCRVVTLMSLNFVKRICMMWSSEDFAKFLYLRGNYIESVLCNSNEYFINSRKKILSEISTASIQNDFYASISKNLVDEINMHLLYFKKNVQNLKPLHIVDKILEIKQSCPESGLITPYCESLIKYEEGRKLISGFLSEYIIVMMNNNLSEFDRAVFKTFWDYLNAYYDILSNRLNSELELLKFDRSKYIQDMSEWDNAISCIKESYNNVCLKMNEALNGYHRKPSCIDSEILIRINTAFEDKLKKYFKDSNSEILNDIIEFYNSSESDYAKLKLYQNLEKFKSLGEFAYPFALGLRVLDANLPTSWNSFFRIQSILYKYKQTYLNTKEFRLLNDNLKQKYLSILMIFFRNPEERLKLVDMYEGYPEGIDLKNFLILATSYISNECFYSERSSQITATLTLLRKVDNLKGEINDSYLNCNINKINDGIKSNASKFLKDKVKVKGIRKGNWGEKIGAKIIPTTGSLEKLISVWDRFGAHNMNIKDFRFKEDKIFANMIKGLNNLYENGNSSLTEEYALRILSKLSIFTVYSSYMRVARFKQLEKFIPEDSIPDIIKEWMEYKTGIIYVDEYEDIEHTLSVLEEVFKKYNDRMTLPSHYESAYSFVEAIRFCISIYATVDMSHQ